MRSSSSTKRRSPLAASSTGTNRGSVGGIFTRAKWSSIAVARRLFELDGEREREVRDVRERVAAIDRQRREHRKDALVEGALQRTLRFVVEFGDAQEADALALERRKQLVVEDVHLPGKRGAQPLRDCGEMLGRRAAVFRTAHDLSLDLLLDRRHADHEELVEIGSVNRDELQALEQRVAFVEAPPRGRGR